MGDHFAAFAILHASISKTLKTLRDFSREKKTKAIYERAAFQELISPFEKCGVELQQRLDTVSDIYAFLVRTPHLLGNLPPPHISLLLPPHPALG
jgi:putative NIF3 family GTP cyclohydrolase 1 type 2